MKDQSAFPYSMAGFGSIMLFNILLVLMVKTCISAEVGEESVTVFTLKEDPVNEHFHTSEHITGNRDINEEVEWKNMIFHLVEILRFANKQEEHSTFDEDISEDVGLTSDFGTDTTKENLDFAPRNFINAPIKPCGPNETLNSKGECVEVV